VLICGDATFSTEYAMLASDWGKHLKSDALEGGHHGSADSFSDEFLQRVNPSWIHFSADNRGTFRHPTWETVDRVRERYSWDAVTGAYEALLKKIAGQA
jgi:competence protein ComEC